MHTTSGNTGQSLVSLWYTSHMIKNVISQQILTVRIVAMVTAECMDVLHFNAFYAFPRNSSNVIRPYNILSAYNKTWPVFPDISHTKKCQVHETSGNMHDGYSYVQMEHECVATSALSKDLCWANSTTSMPELHNQLLLKNIDNPPCHIHCSEKYSDPPFTVNMFSPTTGYWSRIFKVFK